MSKIDLKQPKYIIPGIILPFLFLGFYFFTKFTETETPQNANEIAGMDGINPTMPDATLEEPLSKFEAYKEAMKVKRRNNGLKDLEMERGKTYSYEQDSLQKQRDSVKEAYNKAMAFKQNARTKNNLSRKRLMEAAQKRLGNKSKKKTSSKSKKETEMQDFRSQMRIIDSMQNPSKYAAAVPLDTIQTEKTLKISKKSNQLSDHFNTIKAKREETMITALLDEGIKVWSGSRVRVRLLEDFYIDETLFVKGSYLYGVVGSFGNQRVGINITSVLHGEEILPVNISLYDNDGISGIYVPDSAFRDFAKELGKSQAARSGNVRLNNGPQNNTQLMYNSISTAMQSTSKAIRQAFQKNKARLKYNTQVYLVNNN